MPLYHDEYDGPNDVEIGIEVVESGQPVQVMDIKARTGARGMTAPLPTGVYGAGMDQYVRDEAELGGRVAASLDDEQHTPGAAFDDWRYAQQVAAEIREQETNRQLQTGMAEKEGGQ